MAKKKTVETEATEKVEKEIAVEEEPAPVEEPAKVETPEKSDDKKKKIIIAIVAILLIILAFLLWFFNRKFDVKFDPNNGDDKYTVQVKYNKLIDEKDIKDQEELGEDFIDWYLVIVDEDGKETLEEDPFDFEHEKIKKDIELRAVYKGEPAPVDEEPVTEAPIVEPETTTVASTTTTAAPTTTKKTTTTTTTKAAEKAPTIKLSASANYICAYAGTSASTVKATVTNAKDSDVTWKAEISESKFASWSASGATGTLTALKAGGGKVQTAKITATVKNSAGSSSDSVTITIEPQLILRNLLYTSLANYNNGVSTNTAYTESTECNLGSGNWLTSGSDTIVIRSDNTIPVTWSYDSSQYTERSKSDTEITVRSTYGNWGTTRSITATTKAGQKITLSYNYSSVIN